MKTRYLSIVAALSGVLLLSSCNGFLDEMPQNKLKPTTTEDYEQLLNKAYISEQIMPYLDILSDDVDLIATDHVMEGTDNGDYVYSAFMWQTTHENSMPKKDIAFEKLYNSVYYANVVITSIDNAVGMELNEANVRKVKNNLKGEAYAVRAYAYFYLVNLYAPHYDPATAATTMGMPINTGIAAEDRAYVREPLQEVYDLIINDLKDAVRLMDENPIPRASKTKFTETSARALLARVYLYTHQWDNAIAEAKTVITENPAIYNLFEEGKLFTIANNGGTSWSEATSMAGTDYLSKDNANVLFVNGASELMPALTYWPFATTFSVNKQLAAVYETGDVRRFYFMKTYDKDTYAGLRSKLSYAKNRYMPFTFDANDPSSRYSRVIRTEEMYLIVAEASAHKADGQTEAVKYLNDMRIQKFLEGAYVPLRESDFATNEALLDFIYLERRRELCFEQHRWFDLRRTTRPAMTRVGYSNEVATLKKDDPRYVLQIPDKELSVNSDIGMAPR